MVEIDCADRPTHDINVAIKDGLQGGEDVIVRSPASRHNLGVGINSSGKVIFDGNVGYYCCGMLRQADVEVRGNCGWGVGEDMMSGSIVVLGNASAAAGAALRGGTLVIHGNAGPRAGISQKGGAIVIGGGVGYMSGFIQQKGVMVICGDAGEALGDSLYEGRIFVGGNIDDLGSDAVKKEVTDEDAAFLDDLLSAYGIAAPRGTGHFTKIVSGKRLYNFDKRDYELWRVAL